MDLLPACRDQSVPDPSRIGIEGSGCQSEPDLALDWFLCFLHLEVWRERNPSSMDAARRAEHSRACIHGRTVVPDHTAIRIGFASSRAGSPSPATATAGFMSSIISAKRAHKDNSNYPVNNKRRLTLRACVKVDSSKWIGSQRLNFLSLPEDVVLRITAELTLKEAVRMSVVCSSLRRAWIYHPNLDFGISTVPGSGAPTVPDSVISTVRGSKARSNPSSDQHKRMLSIKRFIDTVNLVLRKHSGLGVNKIAIKFELGKEQSKDIDGWVSFAIASKAKAVILKFSLYVDRMKTIIASHIIFSTTKMHHTFSSPVLQDFQYFLLKCPALEWLSIRLCSQLHNLHAVEPLQQLKFLSVQHCATKKIELNAPNLTTFEYRGRSKVVIALHESLKLKTVSIAFSFDEHLGYFFTELPNGIPHTETLHVTVLWATRFIPGFTQAPFKFIYLRHLTMKITITTCRRFVMLCIDCECPPRRDVITDRPHHNLRSACITGYNGNGGQVALVKYILRNAVQLERMVIDPKGRTRDQVIGPFLRTEAKLEFVPEDKNGALTIL
ncbi:hypothetical protein ACP70R_048373 [Stipagrostis hirtigluma subsp. patula]